MDWTSSDEGRTMPGTAQLSFATRDHLSRPAQLWRFRELIRSLVVRNLKVRYQRSAIGFLWTLLNPVLTATVLALVFAYIVRIGIEHYWAFLLSGFFVWNFISQMVSVGSYALLEHSALRRSAAFPEEIPILSAGLTRLLEFAVELALAVLAIAAFHHGRLPPSFALLPVLVLLLVLVSLGLALLVATLSVFFTDTVHVVPIALLVLFYLSPVFYPASFVTEPLRYIYLANPLAGLLIMFQTVLFDGALPPFGLSCYVTIVCLASAAIGYVVFNRHKSLFAEIV